MIQEHGLGRLPQFDPRSRNYPLRAVMRAQPVALPASRYWRIPRPALALDQGQTPMCAVYSQQTLLQLGPVTNRQGHDLFAWYQWAQQHDYWPGEDYAGTSVLAAVQYGVEQGWFAEYRWQFSLSDCVEWVLGYGPLVVGTWWDWEMFNPDAKGFIHPTGNHVGGHAYTICGGNQKRRVFKLINTWSNSWGINGCAWITFDELWALLADQGEGLAVLENKLPR